MTAGKYSLIRCIPDPIRGEVFNIGAIVWDEKRFRIEVDEKAARRAVAQSRTLAHDAWLHFEDALRVQVVDVPDDRLNIDNLERLSSQPPTGTLLVSRPTSVRFDETADSFENRINEIINRMVRPRSGGGAGSPIAAVESRLKPFIRSGRLHKDWPFPRTRSGKHRSADFYLNSGTNIALDAVRADYARIAEASRAVDAEAYKIEDVFRAGVKVRYLVYSRFLRDANREAFNEESLAILTSAGAEVMQSVEEAAGIFEKRIAPKLQLVGKEESPEPDPQRRTSGD